MPSIRSVPPLRVISRTARVALVALAWGCADNTEGMPRSWGPVAVAEDASRCPTVEGTYVSFIREGAEDAVFPSLVRPQLSWYALTLRWDELVLTGDANQSLTADVAFMGGHEERVTITRGRDYRCEDGWIVAPTPYGVVAGDDDIPREQQSIRPDAREVFIAPGRQSSLVGRLETREEHEFPLWCGDGCKGIRLPWRTKRAVAWSRMITQIDPAEIAEAEDGRAAMLSDSARVVQLAQRSTPPGAQFLSAVPLGGTHWRLRFRADRDVEQQALVDELMTTPFFADVADESKEGARLPNGALLVEVFVRLVR